jgi:predicted  nucleic acid-binding Zn-ribbon protein
MEVKSERIKSICPKCGREGFQYVSSSKSDPSVGYLRMYHGRPNGKLDMCYIGRISSGEDFMGEMNKPETLEEYQEAMRDVSEQIRELAKYYSTNSAIRWKIIAPRLLRIVGKYGY